MSNSSFIALWRFLLLILISCLLLVGCRSSRQRGITEPEPVAVATVANPTPAPVIDPPTLPQNLEPTHVTGSIDTAINNPSVMVSILYFWLGVFVVGCVSGGLIFGFIYFYGGYLFRRYAHLYTIRGRSNE